MGFFNSLRNIKKWLTEKVEFSSFTGSTKRKHEDEECETINNKKVRMDDYLVKTVKTSNESETDGGEITESEPFIVPVRASPLVMLIEGSQHARSTMSPVRTIDLSESNNDDVNNEINPSYSLSNPQLPSNWNIKKELFYEIISRKFKEKLTAAFFTFTRIIKLKPPDNIFPEELELMKKEIDKIEPQKKNEIFPGYSKEIAESNNHKIIKLKPTENIFLEELELMKKEIDEIEPQKKNEIFPGYSKEIAESIALQMSGLLNEFIVQGKNIRKKDLKTIYTSTAWVNDEVINHYLDMIADRDPTNIHTFSTYFYTKLSLQGYQSVRRWSRNKDIFVCKKMFTPIHLHNHWCLICVNFVEKTIKYYDSLGYNFLECLNIIFDYLKQEYENKKNEEFDCSGWQIEYAEDCPKQQNDYDCGVFTCVTAEYLSRDAKLDFVQDDMPKLRNKICYEILNNRLCN